MCYNQADFVKDIPEGFGWKPVHVDEFWPPKHIMLSVSAGIGMLHLCMILVLTQVNCIIELCMKLIFILYMYEGIRKRTYTSLRRTLRIIFKMYLHCRCWKLVGVQPLFPAKLFPKIRSTFLTGREDITPTTTGLVIRLDFRCTLCDGTLSLLSSTCSKTVIAVSN